MAAVEETFKNKKSLICTLCQEKFQQPVILPCMHTYCEKCLGDFITSLAKSKADEKLKDFRCPTCRIPVRPKDPELEVNNWAATLPRNIVMEIMITLSEGKQQLCQTCACFNEQSVASVWCAACEEAMCEKCTGMHARMKLLKHHRIYQIKNLCDEFLGMHLNAVPSICRCQHAKQIEHICHDHGETLCTVCRYTSHSQCQDVNDVSTLVDEDPTNEKCIENKTNLRESIVKLKSEKQKEKEELKTAAQGLIEEAKNSIEEIKIKLDSLFESFKKQVLVFHEEEITKSNVRLRLLEQLAKNIDHWRSVTTMLKDQKMKREGIIFIHEVKQQLGESIREISNLMEPGVISRLIYHQCELEGELGKCDSIGSFTIEKEYPESEIDIVYERCEALKVPLWASFDDLKIEFVQSITVDCAYNLTCGECLNRHFLVLGDYNATGELYMVDINTGSVAKSESVGNYAKRLCIDKNENQVFVACYNTEMFCIRLQDSEFQKPEKLGGKVGGMVVRKDDVHVIANGEIKKFVSSANPNATGNEMTMCFTTNTSVSGFGDIIAYKENMLFTSKDNEIKCTTLDGSAVFCFKDAAVRLPIALSAMRSGVILALDYYQQGKIHLLSSDGRQFRTILDKFETVSRPRDMWTDSYGRSLYVCGGKNIDIYRIL